MAREIGGLADKDGNEFERLWVVWQALRVLTGDATSLLWERRGAARPSPRAPPAPEESRHVVAAVLQIEHVQGPAVGVLAQVAIEGLEPVPKIARGDRANVGGCRGERAGDVLHLRRLSLALPPLDIPRGPLPVVIRKENPRDAQLEPGAEDGEGLTEEATVGKIDRRQQVGLGLQPQLGDRMARGQLTPQTEADDRVRFNDVDEDCRLAASLAYGTSAGGFAGQAVRPVPVEGIVDPWEGKARHGVAA
jgi:hypothetical protein